MMGMGVTKARGELFELRDGRALLLLEETPHATISAFEWAAATRELRGEIVALMLQRLRAARAAKRAEDDPRIGLLRAALLDARQEAYAMSAGLSMTPFAPTMRAMIGVLENALDEARKIERGR
jgi:hypothetical protein